MCLCSWCAWVALRLVGKYSLVTKWGGPSTVSHCKIHTYIHTYPCDPATDATEKNPTAAVVHIVQRTPSTTTLTDTTIVHRGGAHENTGQALFVTSSLDSSTILGQHLTEHCCVLLRVIYVLTHHIYHPYCSTRRTTNDRGTKIKIATKTRKKTVKFSKLKISAQNGMTVIHHAPSSNSFTGETRQLEP